MVKAANYRANIQNKQSIHFDNQQIQYYARLLKLDVPKNVSPQDYLQFFKSKQFIVTAKGILFQQLHDIVNQTNKLDINFERIKFQFYKGFIGKGNNAPLVVSIFKNHRWWWTIY